MSKSIEELATIAAEWWGNAICNPKFDNGDNSGMGGMATMLALMGTKGIDDESKEKFIKDLKGAVEIGLKGLERKGGWGRIELGVDYHPDMILRTCAESAGISENNFPWKTNMDIGLNYINVRHGYSAPYKLLYANKKYWEDKILSAKSTIKEVEEDKYFNYIKDEDKKKAKEIKLIEDCKKDIIEYTKCYEEAEE